MFKTNARKTLKNLFKVIADACVKVAVPEICSEKNPRESVVGAFKYICTVAVHCWYIKEAFAGFCQQIYFKENSEGILGKIDESFCHA